ncbi:MAG: hypothetical protein WA913_13080 [Pricia sp.]
MAFNYGKTTLDIKNPFKAEGKLDLIFGILTLLLGVMLMFHIRGSINVGLTKLAWLELALSIVFIVAGIRAVIVGSVRLFRFLVGREIPSNLDPELYTDEVIADVLMKRANPTFFEKDDFVFRLLISVYEKFLFLPIGFRNLLEGITSFLLSSLIFLTIYLLTVFSTSIGLINLTDNSSIMTLFGVVFLIKQLAVLFHYRPSKKRISEPEPNIYSYKNIVFNILIAVLVPAVLELYVNNGGIVPSLDINIFLPVLLVLLLSAGIVLTAGFLCLKRLDVMNPETSVSEYKDHIQVSVHPKDIFRCFEIEMANKRYKELPNRVYKQIKPTLELEGSMNKGSFNGDTIQETQPVYEGEDFPEAGKTFRFYVAMLGRMLVLISFIYLFFSIDILNTENSIGAWFRVFYYPLVLSLFGHYLIRIAHIFYSEVLFSSYLVHFFSEGTYTESKISSGMSVYDSNRSENTIVNTSATPWILVSKIITSTLADSSTKNLEGPRYILEMYKGDNFLNDLVNGFTNYLKDRSMVVGLNTKADIERSIDFHKLNEMTRASRPPTDKIEEQKRDELNE